MAEIPRLLREGMYLTDGRRLVMIKRVLDDTVTIEAGPTDAPELGVLAKTEIGATWRILDVPGDDGSTERWLREHFPVRNVDALDARTRCGCARCRRSLAVDRGEADG